MQTIDSLRANLIARDEWTEILEGTWQEFSPSGCNYADRTERAIFTRYLKSLIADLDEADKGEKCPTCGDTREWCPNS